MKNPLVSVIMPVYNAEAYLCESIVSILNQSYKNIELIIIDDGSTDDSLVIIQKFQVVDSRIVYRTRSNKGLIFSLNEGLSLARGVYIARMDADDFALPNRIHAQVQYMDLHNLDLCGGDYEIINANGKLVKNIIVPKNEKLITLSLAFKVPFAHPTVMIRSSFLKKNNLCYGQSNYHDAEDYDLWIRCYLSGAKLGNVSEKVLHYRVLEGSLSRSNKRKVKKDTRQMTDKFILDNFSVLVKILRELPDGLNTEEQSIVARFIFYLVIFKKKFSFLKYITKVNFKILLYAFISETKKSLV